MIKLSFFKKIKRNKFKQLIFLFLISLGTLKFFEAPYNLYSLLNWNYNDRMEQVYGYCKNESWGFYKTVNDKFDFKDKNLRIFNDEGNVTLENLFNLKKTSENNTQYLMILNFQSKNDDDIYDWKYDFIKKYKIKFRYNNCYLLELND